MRHIKVETRGNDLDQCETIILPSKYLDEVPVLAEVRLRGLDGNRVEHVGRVLERYRRVRRRLEGLGQLKVAHVIYNPDFFNLNKTSIREHLGLKAF